MDALLATDPLTSHLWRPDWADNDCVTCAASDTPGADHSDPKHNGTGEAMSSVPGASVDEVLGIPVAPAHAPPTPDALKIAIMKHMLSKFNPVVHAYLHAPITEWILLWETSRPNGLCELGNLLMEAEKHGKDAVWKIPLCQKSGLL